MDMALPRPPHYVAAWRHYRKLTQQELAAKAGVSDGLVAQLEVGITNLTAKTARKLASALGVTPGMLIDFSPEEVEEILPVWKGATTEQRRLILKFARSIMEPDEPALPPPSPRRPSRPS